MVLKGITSQLIHYKHVNKTLKRNSLIFRKKQVLFLPNHSCLKQLSGN